MTLELSASKIFLVLVVGYVLGKVTGGDTPYAGAPATNNYPEARRDECVSDTYPGNVAVKDPYRWMEKIDCDETKKFIDAENDFKKSLLDKAPFRNELAARYRELWPFQATLAFFQKGSKYFSYVNDGIHKQDIIYVQDSLTGGEPRVFLDPNTLSDDGSVLLSQDYSTFSDDGMVYAYQLGTADSSWWTIKFKHVEKGDIYKETLTRIQDSYVCFTKDSQGVFYSGYLEHNGKLDATDNAPVKNNKLYYHKLGTDQCQDIVVAEFPDNPDCVIYGWTTALNKYLVVTPTSNPDKTNRFIYIADLAKINYEIKGKLDLIPVVVKDEGFYNVVTNYDTTFIFITNTNAVNYKLISFDLTDVAKSWKDYVPEDKKNVLDFAYIASDKIFLCYMEDSKSTLQLIELKTGKLIRKYDDLEIGTVTQSNSFGGEKYTDFYFLQRSFISPGIIYHVDVSKPPYDLEIFRENKLKNFDRQKFTTEQAFFKSKDGTQIPMFLVHKKDLQKDGNNPVLIVNNSGIGVAVMPSISTNRLLFVSNLGGIYVVVGNRGGGEYGDKWHEAGMLHNKQNIFDDVIAAVEYLIAEKYTNAKLVTAYGSNHGGLIVAACVNQRPELFSVAAIQQGVLDALRFDKLLGGEALIPEIGSPNNAADFQYIFKYSPLHNIKLAECAEKQYPAILLDIAVDDSISPAHSLKYIATLQFEAKNHPNQKNPFIMTYDMTASQCTGSNTYDKAEIDEVTAEYVDLYSFIMMNTGIKFQSSCQ